ncbi:hypothetical protein LINPERPRIM_LOCUS22587 [Linum perenne]
MRVLSCNIQSPLIWFSNPPSKEDNKEEQEQERSSDIVNEAAPHPKTTEKDKKKKKVQWMDFVGKPLFEIREYELSSSETEQREWDVEMNKKCCCACVIL